MQYSRNRKLYRLAISVVPVFLLGCSNVLIADSDVTAPGSAVQTSSVAANSETRRGKLLYLQCRACHSTESADGHLVGPNLSGLFGAVAGTKTGFIYSPSLASSGVIWNEETLDRFLFNPGDYFADTKMAFVGISDENDRRELIAYLKRQAD